MGKFCFMLFVFYFYGLLVLLAINTKDATLKQVHILFRHGERSPSKTYPNDPHIDHKWPGGWDQLSTSGKIEEYNLGLFLRKRYNSLLPEEYHQDDVYIQSSYADRCIMSAQLLLAGLYPPKKEQIWNYQLLWQPIPVHSIPRYIDNKIAIKAECPKYAAALKQAYNSEEIANINEANKELFENLTIHTGDYINNIRDLETLYNTLEIEQINNLTLPKWTKSVYPEKMKDLAAMSLAIFTQTEFMKRMHGGVLVKEMLREMFNKQNGVTQDNKLMYLYSGHDLTVVTLLRVLGFSQLIKPEFGASVILEMHEINKESILKFFYKPNPYSEVEEMTLDGCGIPCKLENLDVLLKNVMPTDWEKECLM